MPPKLDSLFEEMIQIAKHNRETQKQFTPVLIIIDSMMRIEIAPMIFSNQQEKETVMDHLNTGLRRKYQAGQLYATITIIDAWVRTLDNAAAAVYLGAGKHPMTDPKRQEALVAMLRMAGDWKTVELRYHREQGKIVWDGRAESKEGHTDGVIRDWSRA